MNIILSFTSLLILSFSLSAAEFSFERSYVLKMPTNAKTIGAVMELKDYFHINPKISNVTAEINNLSWRYKGFSKSSVKAEMCLSIGKLSTYKERIELNYNRLVYQSVPRVYNEAQSKALELISKTMNTYSTNLSQLTDFCKGDLSLSGEEIRDIVNPIGKSVFDNSSNTTYYLDSDSILAPQGGDEYYEYIRAKYQRE